MNDFAVRVLSAPLGKTYLFSAGQAGYIIKSRSGQLFAWDLYLSECGERIEGHVGFKRLLPHILAPDELHVDCLVASHPHFDHFDMDAMPFLMASPRTQLFTSVNCRKEAERLWLDASRITYVAPGQACLSGDFTLHFVSCDHGTLAPDAVGAVVEVDGFRVFFTGDTCLRLDRVEEYLSFGPLDVLIAPINGAYGNLNEQDCVLLSKALQPGLTIPCHYGMFASHGGNPGLFRQYMQAECPGNEYLLMQMGEEFVLQEEGK